MLAHAIKLMRPFMPDTVMMVNVKLARRVRSRLWLGVRLFRLAAWVMGCGVEVVVNMEGGDE